MPQTERTYTEILALIADNTTKQISPQDHRDVVASMMGGYAGLIQSVAGGTDPIAGVDATPVAIKVYDLVTGESIDVNTLGAVATLAAGVVKPGVDGFYAFDFFASFDISANNKTVVFRAFKNGIATDLDFTTFVSNGGDVGGVSLSHKSFPLDANDAVDVRVSLTPGTADVTFTACGLSIKRSG